VAHRLGPAGRTHRGERIAPENALHCAAVKAAVSILSESFALSSIEICEQVTADKVIILKDHELTRVNRQPTPEANAQSWWDAMQNLHGIWGNA
jgi:phage portal protein BeeE